MSLYPESSWQMSSLAENSSTPSKINRTLDGFWIMYFHTSSFRFFTVSEPVKSSRRLRFFTELNRLNFIRKATSKFPSLSVSNAATRSSFVERIVLPMPGQPTTRIFLCRPSMIFSTHISPPCWSALGIGDTLGCLHLPSRKLYFARPSCITKFTKIWSISRSLGLGPSPGLGRIGCFRSLSCFVPTITSSFKLFKSACSVFRACWDISDNGTRMGSRLDRRWSS